MVQDENLKAYSSKKSDNKIELNGKNQGIIKETRTELQSQIKKLAETMRRQQQQRQLKNTMNNSNRSSM